MGSANSWLSDKWTIAWIVIRSLKIEPFIFLFVLSTTVSNLTTTQLIQDKICVNKYHRSQDYCVKISTSSGGDDDTGAIDDVDDGTRSHILADLAQFSIYTTIMGTLPAFFYLLFIGPFLDSYIHARKLILMLGMFGYGCWYSLQLLMAIKFHWDHHYMLLSYIPVAMFGGWPCVWLTAYSYMTNNTIEKYRFIKFAVYELAVFIAGPLGTYLGGLLLGNGNPDAGANNQIHNYKWVFAVSIGTSLMAFIWVTVVINEKSQRNVIENKPIADINGNNIIDNNKSSSDDEELSSAKCVGHIVHSNKFRFRYMFDVENLRQVVRTALKPRPNRGRTYLWLLFFCMCIVIMSDIKAFSVLFPYTERQFGFDAQTYSYVRSVAEIGQIIIMAVTVPILSTYFQLSDTKMGIIGLVSIFASDMLVGSCIRSPIGLYLMYGAASIANISSVAIRALLSKIATDRESGRVFCLLGALEAIIPTLQSLYSNTLFEYTIDWYPSLCFQTAGAFTLIPIYIFIWMDLTYLIKPEDNTK